jgi:hypothetical protein
VGVVEAERNQRSKSETRVDGLIAVAVAARRTRTNDLVDQWTLVAARYCKLIKK